MNHTPISPLIRRQRRVCGFDFASLLAEGDGEIDLWVCVSLRRSTSFEAKAYIVVDALALRAVVVRLVERARAVGGRAVVADAVATVVVPEAGGDREGVAGGGRVSRGA